MGNQCETPCDSISNQPQSNVTIGRFITHTTKFQIQSQKYCDCYFVIRKNMFNNLNNKPSIKISIQHRLLNFRMESFMKAIGQIKKDKDMENKLGKMDHITKVNGIIIELMEKEHFIIRMVRIIQENLKMIVHMAMEKQFAQTETIIKANGRMIYNMDKVYKFGNKEELIEDFISKEKNKDLVSTNGLTEMFMKEIGLIT